jgi:FkbM family methyltransferase
MKQRTAWEKALNKFHRMYMGIDSPWEFLLIVVGYFCGKICGKKVDYARAARKRLKRNYLKKEFYEFKSARLPLLDPINERVFFRACFEDTFHVYLNYEDCYNEVRIRALYEDLEEGPYGLRNDVVDVVVEAEDVVLDAGSWIGDFAAYASAKGASAVYAFEPAEGLYGYLTQTAELNKNIYAIKKGLGNINTTTGIFQKDTDNTGASKIVNEQRAIENGEQYIEITTIDTFVEEKKLARVDFIKADIEGSERYMLEGARGTLKKFAPKLAICTYHLPDDPDVLESIIKNANPAYKVVQKRKKLYASVPVHMREKL